jgi:hypothetical protein
VCTKRTYGPRTYMLIFFYCCIKREFEVGGGDMKKGMV